MEVKVGYWVPPDIQVFVDQVLEEGVLLTWRDVFEIDDSQGKHELKLKVSGYIAGLLGTSYPYKGVESLQNIMSIIQTTLLFGKEVESGYKLEFGNRQFRKVFYLSHYGQTDDLDVAEKYGQTLYPSPWPIGIGTRFGIIIK